MLTGLGQVTTVKARSDKQSAVAFGVLLAVSSLITVFSMAFGVYALVHNVSFSVMSAQIPGVVFAAVGAFLGIRYCLASLKMGSAISGKTFSWKNFKSAKEKPSVH